MENERHRLRLEIFKKDDTKNNIKRQSNSSFSGVHKSYENCHSYIFKQNEIRMDKPIYLGIAVLEISKIFIYETYYHKLQPIFGEENLQFHYMESVTKDTPIILKGNEKIKILKVDENISEEKWYQEDNILTHWGYKECGVCN